MRERERQVNVSSERETERFVVLSKETPAKKGKKERKKTNNT